MKPYLKSFKIPSIVLIVMVIIYALLYNFHGTVSDRVLRDRDDNSTTHRRVFDYADKLTDSQEKSLQELIERRRDQCGLDIVLVTLDEDLKKWYRKNSDEIAAYGYDGRYYEQNIDDSPEYKEICVWANVFYDEKQFGYDGFDPDDYYSGNGVMLVDNWYKDNQQIWFLTSGSRDIINFYERNDADASWHIIDLVGDLVVFNPYLAYKTYIDTIYFDQVGLVNYTAYTYWQLLILAPLIISFIVMFAKKNSLKAKDTTTSSTYLGHQPNLKRSQDIFINKYVTSHTIQSSSGGGGHYSGGGHHGGGHSHGGHGGGH